MTARTIQAGLVPERLRDRPLGVLAVSLVAVEAGIALLGGHFPAVAAAILVLAPGIALLPALPARARDGWLPALAAAPALGFAASSVLLISASSAGLPLNGTVVRLAVAVLVLAGLLAFRGGEPILGVAPGGTLAGLGLLAAVLAGLVLQDRVIGGSPVPGNDWAKYVLYADEIRVHGSLLIDNPFWMLGVPFREDPGVPSLYGSYLALTGQPAAVLAHGIWIFAVTGILSTYAFVRAFWGDTAGVLAAAFWAVLPISHDILGWHGLANVAALALLPILLLYVTALVHDGLAGSERVAFGLLLVALAATHRLSLAVGLAAVLATLAVGLLWGGRRRLLRGALGSGVAALVIAPGVAYDLVTRGRTSGGTQDYTAYLTTKVDLARVAGDLTPVFSLVAVVAGAMAVRWCLRERGLSLVPLLALLTVVVVLAYSWILELPLAYLRMAYFLPLALVPLVAIALTRILRADRAAVLGAGLAAVVAVLAWGQASNVRDFYGFANRASVSGLDAVAARLEPGEVVVTDRCWSFLATWLLQTRTLPGLEPEDIQPKAEVPFAERARSILSGTAEGRALARRLGVRFLIVDPTCSDSSGRPLEPPPLGRPVFVSERLAVLVLGPRRRALSGAAHEEADQTAGEQYREREAAGEQPAGGSAALSEP